MKRCFDLALILLILPVYLPLMLMISLWVWYRIGTPILFSQQRPGKNGQIFRLYKFRSMTDSRNQAGRLLPDAERLTAFGRWLRSTSFDELPELWNVACGEMSFVGPRPLLVDYLDRYTPEQARRHEVVPGITGWAQVQGRNAISWEDRFRFDVWYVDHQSMRLDLEILWKTLGLVLRREGIRGRNEATMSEFLGTDSMAQEQLDSASLDHKPS
jgi:lipopolysaccharide/colanic/teichoic acid biosynthesis glycosyltransferase